MWNFIVYTGKETEFVSDNIPKTESIVKKLVGPLLGRGYTLWMDNYYNSPSLARELKTIHATDCVGTLRLSRKNVPKQVKEKKLKRGEIFAQHSGPVMAMKGVTKRMCLWCLHTMIVAPR